MGAGRFNSLVGLIAAVIGAVLLLAACAQPLTVPASLPFQSPPSPRAPRSLSVATLSGTAIHPDSWTNHGRLELSAVFPGRQAAQLVPQVEFVPLSQPLSGKPNLVGQAGQQSIAAPAMQPGQRYHWAIRLRASDGQFSPWVPFNGSVGYQPSPPAAPVVQPLGHHGVVASRQVRFTWKASTDPAGTAGFAYSVDRDPRGATPPAIRASSPKAVVNVPADGTWYFHLRAVDGAGNASAMTTTAFHVDSAPLTIEKVNVASNVLNPMLGTDTISVSASKRAHLSLSLLPAGAAAPIRVLDLGTKQAATAVWDGKGKAGQPVPGGVYRVEVTATDAAGRTAQLVAKAPLTVTYKRIVVSLSQQRLWAYQGSGVVLTTLVTTGGPELPTPTGVFHVLAKDSPFTFHSPWPKGSPYWYPDSPASYALLYQDQGYFIHDAPWRSRFGPGSNSVWGTPAGPTTGSHGCVNVPLKAEAALFAWARVGTPVIIQH